MVPECYVRSETGQLATLIPQRPLMAQNASVLPAKPNSPMTRQSCNSCSSNEKRMYEKHFFKGLRDFPARLIPRKFLFIINPSNQF
jgi:hypothetical protein